MNNDDYKNGYNNAIEMVINQLDIRMRSDYQSSASIASVLLSIKTLMIQKAFHKEF